MLPLPPRSTLFPYTTLFRSLPAVQRARLPAGVAAAAVVAAPEQLTQKQERSTKATRFESSWAYSYVADRKSTRLNSSHGYISYAVFCLKKKKKNRNITKIEQ